MRSMPGRPAPSRFANLWTSYLRPYRRLALAVESLPRAGHDLPQGWRIVTFGEIVRQTKVDADPETSGLERYVAGEHMDTDDLHIRRWGTIGDGYLGPAFR